MSGLTSAGIVCLLAGLLLMPTQRWHGAGMVLFAGGLVLAPAGVVL